MRISLLYLLFIALISACSTDEKEEFKEVSFSEEDMTILKDYLDLPQTAFNYSHLDLPNHFYDVEPEETDNTPPQNPITNMGATLGRVLFYDKSLSIDYSISCASCHDQKKGFSDSRRFSEGVNGQLTKRNSMSLLNSRYYENGRFFWDERSATLEDQVLVPIQDHIEMGLNLDSLSPRLSQLPYYPILFRYAFGSEDISKQRIAYALSQFVRSIVSYRSKFDEGLSQMRNPEVGEQLKDLPNFTDQENLGLDIFMRGRKGATCQYCHGTPQIIGFEARNNGLAKEYVDKGKGKATGKSGDNDLFKPPSLKSVALTPPYMHDGRFETLMDVVNHYSDGVQAHPNLHFRLSTIDDGPLGSPPMKLGLNQEEKEALVAFLKTLTDHELGKDEKYSDPFAK